MKLSITGDSVSTKADAESRDLLWLGAGFSTCVTLGELPIMSNFCDRITEAKYESLYRFMSRWFGNPLLTNIEEVMMAVEQLAHSPLEPRGMRLDLGDDEIYTIRRELALYCHDRLSRHNPDSEHWAFRLLMSVDEHTNILTTNYDTVAESILLRRPGLTHRKDTSDPTCASCKVRLIHELAKQGACDEQRLMVLSRGALLKLHGSIDWVACVNVDCQNRYIISENPFRFSATCCGCGKKVQPVIVLPSAAKDYEAFPHLRRVWEAAFHALADVERIVVFGFSFPLTDTAIALHFRSCILQNPHIRSIAVIDTHPDLVCDRIQKLVGQDKHLELNPFVVPINGSIPRWWKPVDDLPPANYEKSKD